MSLLALCPRSGDGPVPHRLQGWRSPVTIPRRWVVAAFLASAVFAGGMAVFSRYYVDRLWGFLAACGYMLAALVAMAWKSRGGLDMALTVSFCVALVLPLAWMAATGQGQPEVGVVERSAELLVHRGDPYQSSAALRGTQDPNAYDPYLPLMSVFGLVWASGIHGVPGDPRVWFGLTFLAVFGFALAVAGARDAFRWLVFIAASPIVALELATGGTDIPVLGLLCLGFALLWRQLRSLPAAVVFGAAAALKATAWPAVAVAVVYLVATGGRRAAIGFVTAAAAVVAVLDGPVAVTRPHGLLTNTVLFPLGLASVKSQADSPLPGHAIAQTGHPGHLLVIALLLLAGLAMGLWLVARPPRSIPDAVARLLVGLTLMFLLAPASRFGYIVYPAVIGVWLAVCLLGRLPDDAVKPRDTDTTGGDSRVDGQCRTVTGSPLFRARSRTARPGR